MSKPIKDLQDLKNLFPDMEPYAPDANEEKQVEKESALDSITSKDKAAMKLYVSRDKKQRAGKQVTLIEGHEGSEESKLELLSKLKSICSAGGSLKDDEMMVQGDHVKKVIAYLLKSGYKNTKQKGG